MKQLSLLLFTIISFAISLNAQTVTLCKDYNSNTGAPIEEGKYWDIDDDGKGSNVYLIYKQDKAIKEDLKLYIDKKNTSGSYIAYATKYFYNDISSNAKTWAMYDVNFTEKGDYRLTVIGKNGTALAVTYTNIDYKKNDPSDANKKKIAKKDAPDTYYYEYSEITLGTSINDGILSGVDTTFYLFGTAKEITAKLEQTEALKLTKIYVDIYTGSNYEEKVSSLGYNVDDPTWNWISVPIKFYKKGKYVVDFYTQDDVFINSYYFSVK